MIAIVDYGMGNPGSIRNMLLRIGVEAAITFSPETIASADKLVLPGVGAFDAAVTNLRHLGLIPILQEQVVLRGVPILGICLGMQLLSRSSEEGSLPGLGWIDARTVRFRFDGAGAELRIPHMGWNHVDVKRSGSIFDGLPRDARFYFVHSYHVCCEDEANVLAATTYGIPFHSAIVRDNIMGTQFHPEKSHKFGMQVLRNFAEAGR
jgi:glutamine amidotransferase